MNLRQEWRGTNHTTHQPQSKRLPREGKRRKSQAGPPPRKKKGGGVGPRENSPQPPNRPPTTQKGAKPPTQRAPKTGPPNRHRGTTQPKPATPSQKQRPGRKRGTETSRKKRKKSQQPSPKERRRAERPQGPAGIGTPSNRKKKSAKNTTRQPSQEGRGTAETRAQHARPHRTPEPETAGGKGNAQETTQVPKAGRHQSPTTNTTNSRQKRDNTTNRAQTHPPKTPATTSRGKQNLRPTATRAQPQTQANSRKPSAHSPGTEAAHAMQVTRPNEIRSPGVRLHPKACAALGLEAERATPKRLGTLVPRTCMHALGTGYARKSGEPLGFLPKGGDVRSHGGPTSWRDKHVTLAAISPPGVARGRFVGGQQSGLAGSKPPPLFTRGASSCSSQGRRQGEPWGASPRPSAPTHLPARRHGAHCTHALCTLHARTVHAARCTQADTVEL